VPLPWHRSRRVFPYGLEGVEVRRVSSVVLGLILIACGGASQTSDQTTISTASTDTTTATTTGQTNTGTDGAPSADCLQLSTTLSAASTLGLGPASGDATDTVQALQNMAAVAPAEIADDLEVLAAAYGEFLAALEDAGVDFANPSTFSSPEAQAAMTAATESLNAAEVTQASENITAYIGNVCE
jgi:hypothetical protein